MFLDAELSLYRDLCPLGSPRRTLADLTLIEPIQDGLSIARHAALNALKESAGRAARAPLRAHMQNRDDVSRIQRMVYCPARIFTMGTDIQEHGKGPAHAVRLSRAYWMGQTPVTQDLYEYVMGVNPSHFKGLRRPVERVSWLDAVRFCNRLSELEGRPRVYLLSGEEGQERVEIDHRQPGYRLPTEAEWESAARASNALHRFAGGNDLELLGWSKEHCAETQEVALKLPNAWHLYDMSGNVLEWCVDMFQAGLYQQRDVRSVTVDPCVLNSTETSTKRILRGGSYYNEASYAHICYRGFSDEHTKSASVGFRVALSILNDIT